MTKLLAESHRLAYEILQEVEHIRQVDKPKNDTNLIWHQAYHGWKARQCAYRAMHQLNAVKASALADNAVSYYKLYKGET